MADDEGAEKEGDYCICAICTHRAVYSYIIIHMIISALSVFVNTFRFLDHIPWVSTSRCEKLRPKQETSCCTDRSDIGRRALV